MLLRISIFVLYSIAVTDANSLAKYPNIVNLLLLYNVKCTARQILAMFQPKEITMKQLIALVAAVATASVFAQAKPAEAPKAAPAAAPAASAPAAKADATKSEAKPAAPKKVDKKAAEPAKK